MACIVKGKITKKRIMVLSGAASGLAVAIYLVPTLTTTMSGLLSMATCPAMCAGMCGVFFLANHLSGINHKKNQILERKAIEKLLIIRHNLGLKISVL